MLPKLFNFYILTFVLFASSNCIAVGQTATLFISTSDYRTVDIIVNQDTIPVKGTDFTIFDINVEIVGIIAKDSLGNQISDLVFMRLDESSYVSLDFDRKKIVPTRKFDAQKARLKYQYKPFSTNTVVKKPEDQLVTAKPVLDKVKPKYTIDAASILQNNKEVEKPNDGIIISKPETTAATNTDIPCSLILRNNELKSLKNLLKNTKAIDVQMSLTQSSLRNKCIYATQLQEVFKMIEEDDIKVNLFKKLYAQLQDPQKRNVLYSELLFETSIEEIKNYEQ